MLVAIYLLVSLLQHPQERAGNVSVLRLGEQRCGDAEVAGAAGTTNLVHVLVNVGRQVKVDDVRDVGDIQTTGSDRCRNQDGGLACAEGLESILALALGAVNGLPGTESNREQNGRWAAIHKKEQ